MAGGLLQLPLWLWRLPMASSSTATASLSSRFVKTWGIPVSYTHLDVYKRQDQGGKEENPRKGVGGGQGEGYNGHSPGLILFDALWPLPFGQGENLSLIHI